MFCGCPDIALLFFPVYKIMCVASISNLTLVPFNKAAIVLLIDVYKRQPFIGDIIFFVTT